MLNSPMIPRLIKLGLGILISFKSFLMKIRYKQLKRNIKVNKKKLLLEFEFTYDETVDQDNNTIFILNEVITCLDGYDYLLSPVVQTGFFTRDIKELNDLINKRADALASMLSYDLSKKSDRLAITKQTYLKYVALGDGNAILPIGWFRKEEDLTTEIEDTIADGGSYIEYLSEVKQFVFNFELGKEGLTVPEHRLNETNSYYEFIYLLLGIVHEELFRRAKEEESE